MISWLVLNTNIYTYWKQLKFKFFKNRQTIEVKMLQIRGHGFICL